MHSALVLKFSRPQSEENELKTVVATGESEAMLAEIRKKGGVLKTAHGDIVGIIVPHPEYELLARAAYIARHPGYLIDLLKRKRKLEDAPETESLTLEEAFGEIAERDYEFSP